jgi:glycosyltransferase involved in cell wall biosynthesis
LSASRHVAYLINLYPQVSHTFIRREILALEEQGVAVERFSIQGWDDPIVDAEDIAERAKTRYVLKDGLISILSDMARTAVKSPGPFFKALKAAFQMSRNSLRPLPYHLVWLAEACRIKLWMEETGATHLHAHFGTNPAEIARLVHLLGGQSYSFTIHGENELDGAKRLHFDKKVGDASFVVAVSGYCRSQIMRHVPPSDWSKMKVVHCGLDGAYFSKQVPDFPETLRFLSVARLSAEKGHLLLLGAFSNVLASHPQSRLVLAGDGPMRKQIELEIERLGLGDAVEITGWVNAERVKDELARATALVQPSFIEGLPVVIMEAMARGRPVISTYVAGIPELVLPGVTGWLVPAGDEKALCDAMLNVATTSSDDLHEMGRVSLERAKDRHSVETEAAKLKALFAGEEL